MRKLILFTLFLIPSLSFADRLGSLKNNAEVMLSSQSSSGGVSVYPATSTILADQGMQASTVDVLGLLTVDYPAETGPFANRTTLSFNPNTADGYLTMRPYNVTSTVGGFRYQDVNGETVGSILFVPQQAGFFYVKMASAPTLGEEVRMSIDRKTALTTFRDNAGIVFSSFTPTFYSGYGVNTTTGVFTSTMTLSASRPVAVTAPSDGQVLKWDSSNAWWEPAADNSGAGGGGTTINVKDGASSIVDTSTMAFNPDQFVITDSGGEALATLNSSSVTLYGPNIPDAALTANVSLLGSQIDIGSESNLAVQLPIILTDDTLSLGAVSLSTGVMGSLAAASIAAGNLGASVIASSLTATGVTAGSYTSANLTVDAQGRITAASSGTRILRMVADLAGAWDVDHEWPLMWVHTPKYPAGIIISSWTVQANVADPTTELNANLKYCDDNALGAFPGANPVLIDVLDTTTGNSSEIDMASSDLTSGTIPAGKKIYLELDADPADATTFYELTIFFTVPTP